MLAVLWCLCVFLWPGSTVDVMLLDTTESTSELGWITYPDTGWDEVSVLDDRGRLIRTFEVCNVNAAAPGHSWLATPFLERGSAPRVFVTLRFSARDCASLRRASPTCRETFTLYYRQADSQREVERTWGGTEGDGETREGWVKIDTIAPDKSFSRVEQNLPHQYQPNRLHRVNVKTRSFGPLTRRGFVLAFVDSGACISLMGVSIFYRMCPQTTQNLAVFPDTPSGAEPAALVPVDGACVPNSLPQAGALPKLHCNAEGDWMVAVGGCVCNEGSEPNQNSTSCVACPVGQYKPEPGLTRCSVCPSHSRTTVEGSRVCECQSGFYRADTDLSTSDCTAPPSAPLSLSWEYEGSGVLLRWRPPLSAGGRDDLSYTIQCRVCPIAPPAVCVRCGDSVTYSPRPSGLTQTRVLLGNLLTRVTYLIQVQAVNGVSGLSPLPPQFATVNFSTSQSVPSPVPLVHQVSRSADSITLSWPQPEQPNGEILEYQLRYYDKSTDEDSSFSLLSQTNMATVGQLSPGSIYAFQIRARNERGYGPYSNTVYFTTLEEHSQALQSHLPLLVGSVMGGAAFLLVAAALVLVFVFRSKRRESPYSDRLQRYITNRGGGVKYYVDPSTYEDPNEAVREFAREIDPAHIKLEAVIGAGQFGEVQRGRYRSGGRGEVAVCVRTLRPGVSEVARRAFLAEAGVMGQFDHPNVLRLEGVVTRGGPERIVTEYMDNGQLDSFLRENEGQFSVLQLVGMLRGIAAGMRYLSEKNFVHRDLAARNILVNANLVCKISDFGLSRLMRNQEKNIPTYTASLGTKIPVRWTAPEAIQHRKFSTASDVWSFGIVMWEVMSYGERPYWDMSNQEVMNAVTDQYRLPAPPSCPAALHILMLDCWTQERTERPGFDNIVSTLDRLMRHPSMLKTVTTTRPSQPLLSHAPPDFSAVLTVSDWLDALKMGRYKEEFDQAELHSLEAAAGLTLEDIRRLGVSLLGHQKKILNGAQQLRVHLNQGQIEV
ncbi:ephrin type-B receptor 5 isoform X2 [Lepisosteus oculatus]|uniref:ephrin type-B receptor 5 isoform X2 n=1 Tax=Lepisosteus oculatus TaxID=7918 RepID=UPI003715C514